jgi:hypothetical protein
VSERQLRDARVGLKAVSEIRSTGLERVAILSAGPTPTALKALADVSESGM